MTKQNGETKESLVTCQTSQGVEIRAVLVRLTRYSAVLEIYNPGLVLRMSEVLEDCKILINGQLAYAGKAIVSSLVNTGTVLICEVKLEEAGLMVPPLSGSPGAGATFGERFGNFLQEWQKFCRVLPEFKDVLGDMQTFLADLRLWLDEVELEVRSAPSGNRMQVEQQVIEELAKPAVRGIDTFIERFEALAENMEDELEPVHRTYLRRQLHPLVLCSPFAYRAYHKPLGYAGDYEMVDMMMRPPYEGSTLFAKLVNVWLLDQAPATAHRNRVRYLAGKLREEALRLRREGRAGRVYSLGCGPAAEIQQYLKESTLVDGMAFTLADFNEETLAHVRTALEGLRQPYGRRAPVELLRRSVQQILKESGRYVERTVDNQFDFVYCAGLFDYLADNVCRRLTGVLYDMVAPGGLLVVTNVSDAMNRSRPFRYSMEYILDWHLLYRNGDQLAAMRPPNAPPDSARVLTEDIGVNVMLEIRKPRHD